MLNVALTGNIAAGKSTVVALFRRWGATVVDADELAREAQAPGSEVMAAIVRRFGSDVLAAGGALDRAALRAKVMGDDEALAALNAIVHPALKRRRDELHHAARARGDVLLVNDIPLLFEALDPAQFDAVVLVDAPVALRRTRLRALRGLSSADADRMIAAQMPAERKRPRSQFVLENDGTLAQLKTNARAVFDDLRRRAARAALGRGGGGDRSGETLVLLSTAKDLPPAFQAIAARYADAGVRVERGGAKALERLKPQVTVATAAAAAAAAAARAAWERAGRPGTLLHLSTEPDSVAVRLDLRPWGGDRLELAEEGASGAPPRADLFLDTDLRPR